MSVLIKNMEMPENCLKCPMCNSNDECVLQSEEDNALFKSWEEQKDGCPLVEVSTPHGDLIDIDSKITVAIKDGLKVTTVRKLLNDRAVRLPKTVIEAEGGDAN